METINNYFRVKKTKKHWVNKEVYEKINRDRFYFFIGRC